jgi:hypothetical protein
MGKNELSMKLMAANAQMALGRLASERVQS